MQKPPSSRRSSRRAFLRQGSVVAALGAWPGVPRAALSAPTSRARPKVTFPDRDLRWFDKPITPVPFPIAIGCAAITWKEGPKVAIPEIAAAGYRGIQLMANVRKDYPDPLALKDVLAKHKLVFVTFSGGGLGIEDPDKQIADMMDKAQYAHKAGALSFQITSPGRQDGVDKGKLKALGKLLTEVGKRTADLSLPVGFHNHMDQWGEKPEEVDAILVAADPRYVKFLIDVGHYRAAGGDPAKAIRKHGKRLLMMHLKDVVFPAEQGEGKGHQFVPLGKGLVDFKAVFAALKDVRYRGWAVVELDSAPAGVAAKDAAVDNKSFVESTLGVKV